MKFFFKSILFLLVSVTIYAQKPHPYVTLKEKVNGKRVELYAVNTDAISYDVFLRVESQDYRRSSARPLIKTIPPNDEVRLITMIRLKGKEGKYTTLFVVNESSTHLNIQKNREDMNVNLSKALQEKEIYIYTKAPCSFCNESKEIFSANSMRYTEYIISNDNGNLAKLNEELIAKNFTKTVVYPIIKVEDSIYTTIQTKQDLFDIFENHFWND